MYWFFILSRLYLRAINTPCKIQNCPGMPVLRKIPVSTWVPIAALHTRLINRNRMHLTAMESTISSDALHGMLATPAFTEMSRSIEILMKRSLLHYLRTKGRWNQTRHSMVRVVSLFTRGATRRNAVGPVCHSLFNWLIIPARLYPHYWRSDDDWNNWIPPKMPFAFAYLWASWTSGWCPEQGFNRSQVSP